MFSMFFFPVDKKLLISNNWNISSPGELLSSSYRELFFINEALNIFLIFLKFLREQIVKAISDRKKRGSKSQGKREIVSTLFTHWKRGLHRTTVVTWFQGNDTLKGLKRGSWKFQQCFRAVEGVGLAGAKFISRPHRLGPCCYGLCSSDRGVGRGWSTRAPWKRRRETRNRGGVVGRGGGGKNAGAKKVRKRKRSTNGRGRNIEGRLLRFAAELRSIMMFPIQICCCFYL